MLVSNINNIQHKVMNFFLKTLKQDCHYVHDMTRSCSCHFVHVSGKVKSQELQLLPQKQKLVLRDLHGQQIFEQVQKIYQKPTMQTSYQSIYGKFLITLMKMKYVFSAITRKLVAITYQHYFIATSSRTTLQKLLPLDEQIVSSGLGTK